MLSEHGLTIAPSTYYQQVGRAPTARQQRDEDLRQQIRRVHADNYSVYGAYIGVDLTANPELLATDLRLACDAAAWFWRRGGWRDLNDVATKADVDTVRAVTLVINGGYNGIDQRIEFFFNAKRVLLD